MTVQLAVDNGLRTGRFNIVSQLKQAANSSGNETIFKDSLSLFDDLDHIKAGKDRKAVIQLFKDAGYNQWPDGRSLEEVIKR